MPEHLRENTSEWMAERMRMELALTEARKAMLDLNAVELIVARAANVIAELDWQQRNTKRFPYRPMAETKRLAIIITQKAYCADQRPIEALEKQRSRTVRIIVLEHEKRDFVESWRNFHQFSLTMYELLHEAGAPDEAARSLVARLAVLEQQGTTPSYDHYGLEQHFDLEWRRPRTYPAKTRESTPLEALPAYGISRTCCCMMNMAGAAAPDPDMELGIEGLTHEPVAAPMAQAAVAPRDLEQGAPCVYHHLQ